MGSDELKANGFGAAGGGTPEETLWRSSQHAQALHIIRRCYNSGATAVLMETPIITEILDSVAERDSVLRCQVSHHIASFVLARKVRPSSCA
jgi:hypothetical protein